MDEIIYSSPEQTKIIPALIEFQKNCPIVKKEDKAQFAYAKLETILYMILPELNKNNLYLEQADFYYGDTVLLKTTVIHESGQFRSSYGCLYSKELLNTAIKTTSDAGKLQQALGAIKTYQCRYALKNFFALPIMDDDIDDGLSEEQTEYLFSLANKDKTIIEKLLKHYGAANSMGIPKMKFEEAIRIVKTLTTEG
ncbi:MAG: ERF family protein [Candidatus Paceibacterota bacterium]|jgi:hypothetical protein